MARRRSPRMDRVAADSCAPLTAAMNAGQLGVSLSAERLAEIEVDQQRANLEGIARGAAENPIDVSRVDRALGRLDASRAYRSSKVQLVTLDEFCVSPDIGWAVRDVIPLQALVVVFGAAKSGKTFAICDLAMHLAHGLDWHGHLIARARRIAFLVGEGKNGLRLRLKAWQCEHPRERRGDLRLIPEALTLSDRVDDVVTALCSYRPEVVVVDTLNTFFGGGDENSTADMTKFVGALRRLVDELSCSVVVIHHSGLADAGRARGSSVLRAAADVVIQVANDDNGSGLIAFQVVEGRDVETWEQPLALKLRRVETNCVDSDGVLLTTCVVERANQPVALPGRGRKPLGGKQRELLSIAQELAKEHANGQSEVTIPRAEISAVAKVRGISRSAMCEALKSLERRGHLKLVEPASVRVSIS